MADEDLPTALLPPSICPVDIVLDGGLDPGSILINTASGFLWGTGGSGSMRVPSLSRSVLTLQMPGRCLLLISVVSIAQLMEEWTIN